MDLVYTSMYRMVEIARFYIPVDHYNFDVTVSIFEPLDSIKVLFQKLYRCGFRRQIQYWSCQVLDFYVCYITSNLLRYYGANDS